MDEPTDGLDPNQKHEVRALIRRMGEEKAIIFSTHILEEVEAACSRAIIISGGEVVANGTPDQLKKKAGEARKLVDVLGTEIMTANGDTNNWFEFQKSKHGAAARVDEVRDSPTIEGYRNKCEFAIGLNPENRRLTVGFKLDPR